jgi:hypothetical protein
VIESLATSTSGRVPVARSVALIWIVVATTIQLEVSMIVHS